jgi:hypothetical protein
VHFGGILEEFTLATVLDVIGMALAGNYHWRLHCSTREHFGMRCIPVHFALPLRTSQRSAHRFWQLRSITRMPCFWVVVLGWTQPASEVRRTTTARAGIFIGQLAKLYRCSGRGSLRSSDQISEAGSKTVTAISTSSLLICENRPLLTYFQAQHRLRR